MHAHLLRRGIACLALLAIACGTPVPAPTATAGGGPRVPAGGPVPSGPTPASPYPFDVVDVRGWGLSTDQVYLLSSLEGIVNRDAARLFVIWNNDGLGWLNSIDDEHYTPTYVTAANLSDLILHYDALVEGVVIFDSQPESANVATPLCGIHHAIMVSQALAPAVLAWPALVDEPVAANVSAMYAAQGFTGTTPKGEIYRWAFNSWFAQCNQGALGMFDYYHAGAVRSMLAGNAIFTMWQVCYTPATERDSDADFDAFEYIIDNSPEDMIVYGYMYPDGGNEHEVVSRLSARGKFLTPSDWLNNAPFLHRLPLPDGYAFQQVARAGVASVPLENKVYVAGIYSDGDNLQYVANFMRWNLWESSAHKTSPVPCSWELSPSVLDVAPAIARFYYDNASANDYFVTGVGGKGYVKAEYVTPAYGEVYWRTTRELMARLDQREVRSWTGNFGDIIDKLNRAPGAAPQCDGIYEGYGGGGYRAPDELDGVPIVYMRGMGLKVDGIVHVQDFLDEMAELRARHPDRPLFVCYHLICWECPYDLWAQFVNALEAGGDAVAVTVAQMTRLIEQYTSGEATTGAILLMVAGIWGVPVLLHLATRARRGGAVRLDGGAAP